MIEIVNIIPNINIGYQIPNLKRLVNTVAHVYGIKNVVHIMPLRFNNFDENAYAVKQGCEYIIFINEKFLKSDKIDKFVIRLIIHEMWHIKQMMEGRLKFNYEHTKAIFNGIEYTNLTAHNKRPFENEAIGAEKKYYSQVKSLLNI
jgi:predicted metallopeptidase